MTGRWPEPGEVWLHRKLPEYMSALIVGRDGDVVTYRRRSQINSSSHETETSTPIHQFLANYQFSPEASSTADTSGAGVADGAPLHLVGDLPFDQPAADMWGVPT